MKHFFFFLKFGKAQFIYVYINPLTLINWYYVLGRSNCKAHTCRSVVNCTWNTMCSREHIVACLHSKIWKPLKEKWISFIVKKNIIKLLSILPKKFIILYKYLLIIIFFGGEGAMILFRIKSSKLYFYLLICHRMLIQSKSFFKIAFWEESDRIGRNIYFNSESVLRKEPFRYQTYFL